jgi:acyl carrier protein
VKGRVRARNGRAFKPSPGAAENVAPTSPRGRGGKEEQLDISNKVREIVADITNNRPADIDENSGAATTDGWDSVAQINIIASIEMEFGLTFSADEMQSLNSIRKILPAIKDHLPEKVA